MHCPVCGSQSKVNNSKNVSSPTASNVVAKKYRDLGEDLTFRQHKCKSCGHCFHTIEIHADSLERKMNEIDRKLQENIEILTALG